MREAASREMWIVGRQVYLGIFYVSEGSLKKLKFAIVVGFVGSHDFEAFGRIIF